MRGGVIPPNGEGEYGRSAAKFSTASGIEVKMSPSRDAFDTSFTHLPRRYPLSFSISTIPRQVAVE